MDNLNEAAAGPLSGLLLYPKETARTLEAPPAFIQFLPFAIYACDAAGRIRWFNPKAAELWGRVPQIGDSTELLHASQKVSFLDGATVGREDAPMASVLTTGRPVRGGEAVVERPDGSRVTATVNIEPITDDDGNILGAITCFQDTTELHRVRSNLQAADERLAQSEENWRRLLDALSAAIYTTDAAGRITYFNQAAADLAGREPALGRDQWCVTWRLYTPEGKSLSHDRCPMAITLTENRPVRGVEAVVERPDGTRVPIMPYPTPLRDASGRLVGAVNMLVDISDRRRSEGRQKVLIDELNHRVKNNMQMLHALLRTAQREAESAEARAVLSDASQRVAAMAAAQQVLYNPTSPNRFDATGFLDAVCGAARQSFGNKIDITIERSSGELTNALAMPLALILNELLVNAAKHGIGGHGKGSIRVGLTKAGRDFELYVEDDGAGFDQEAVRRRSGLRLVVGLTQQLRGKLEVERTPGARCTVRFSDRSAP